MEANITNQTKQCHGFPIPQFWTVLAIGAFGLSFNTISVFHIVKNFILKKSIVQVLLIDSIICIVSSLVLIVVAAIFLVFPTNQICGQLSCYLMQLAVLVPFWLGHTFVFQIAFHRNIVAAANTNQNQPMIILRQHHHKICITTLSIIYLTIVLLLIGFDGIVHQVMNDRISLNCTWKGGTCTALPPYRPIFFSCKMTELHSRIHRAVKFVNCTAQIFFLAK